MTCPFHFVTDAVRLLGQTRGEGAAGLTATQCEEFPRVNDRPTRGLHNGSGTRASFCGTAATPTSSLCEGDTELHFYRPRAALHRASRGTTCIRLE